MTKNLGFLPISKEEMTQKGIYYCDFLIVTGDAYVDHPSFGTAVVSRCLQDEGFNVAILSQPRFDSTEDFLQFGKPRYGILVNSGNIDSMVAHYTAAKKRRSDDAYTPGGKAGKRPDRAVTVYTKLCKKAFPDVPVFIGGLEASLRRFAHYDYWKDDVLESILFSSGADGIMYGMSELTIRKLANGLKKGKTPLDIMRDTRNMCYIADNTDDIKFKYVTCPSFEQVKLQKEEYAKSAKFQLDEQDYHRGKAIVQAHGERYLIQNPPERPLTTEEMDKVYSLPFMRDYHPSYKSKGGVLGIEEVKFSIIHNRGCFGACNFCALALHQGRYMSVRSHESVLDEAIKITEMDDFKGYIHDVGGPTANFRQTSCEKQKKHGLCKDKRCLFPKTCDALTANHDDYRILLEKIRKLPKVKKVFVRSGLRYDYMMADKNDRFFEELVKHHISGQLKVAPEHMSDNVLYYMGKPSFSVYEHFRKRYENINAKHNKNQFLVPYLMSSHPGSTLKDAIKLALYLKSIAYSPEQVQDFYPTPGTISTAMYYTGLDPRTMKKVYIPKTAEEKAMQRALLQYRDPRKKRIVIEALILAKREDLIGNSKECLVTPDNIYTKQKREQPQRRDTKNRRNPKDKQNKKRK